MNTVQHVGFINDADKERGAILEVNGKRASAHRHCLGYKAPQYEKPILVWECYLANDWNESNPLRFEAKTIKALVGKLEKHPYRLVKR